MSRRRCRTAVLAGLAAVAAAQLGLNLALDTGRPHWRDPEFGHRVRRLARLRGGDPPGRPLLVVLGSSRAEMGLSPALWNLGDGPRAYNLSQAGAGPLLQAVNYGRLADAGLTPDFLLIEVIPALLARGQAADEPIPSADPAVVPGESVPVSQLAAADLGRLAGECADFPAYRRKWLAGRLSPWHTHRRTLLDHWGWAGRTFVPAASRRDFQWTELRPDGWAPFDRPDMPAAERAARTAVAAAEYRPLLAAPPAPRPDRVYRRLIARATADGVRVGLLVMPEAPTFRGWYPPGAWAAGRERVRAIAGPAAVCDCGGWLDDDRLFADGHHLLKHGAERFSRRLGDEWVRGWVAGR